MPDVSAISLRMRRGPLAVGLQTFFNAKAFNANIGTWNTAAVTNLSDVSAVPAVAQNAVADARAWMCARSVFDATRWCVRRRTRYS